MEADRGITNFSKESVVEMQARTFIGAFSVCHFFNSFQFWVQKTAVKWSMFYNSLFQNVFDFWIKLSKKNCSKIAEEGQWFCCEKWIKKYKRVRDTSLWKFTGYACGIKVSFSPCVMTQAVLAMLLSIDNLDVLQYNTTVYV